MGRQTAVARRGWSAHSQRQFGLFGGVQGCKGAFHSGDVGCGGVRDKATQGMEAYRVGGRCSTEVEVARRQGARPSGGPGPARGRPAAATRRGAHSPMHSTGCQARAGLQNDEVWGRGRVAAEPEGLEARRPGGQEARRPEGTRKGACRRTVWPERAAVRHRRQAFGRKRGGGSKEHICVGWRAARIEQGRRHRRGGQRQRGAAEQGQGQ